MERVAIHARLKQFVRQNNVERVCTILKQEKWLVNWLVQEKCKHWSFLFLAAEKGFVEIGKLLIQAKANVNQQCFQGKTPLMIASVNGRAEMAKLLLEQPEINVHLYDDFWQTPLYHATANNHPHIIQLLAESKATIKSTVNLKITRKDILKNLKRAVKTNDVESVQSIVLQEPWLVNRLVEQREQLSSFLLLATRRGLHAVAAVLIEAKANVNQQCDQGETPLLCAVSDGHAELVQLLLAQPETALDLENGDRCTALLAAAGNGDMHVARQLLNAKANVDRVDHVGDTALLRACNGQLWLVEQLLQLNANIDHQNDDGVGGLYWAVRRGHAAVADALLAAKAIVDLPNRRGWTPLMKASSEGRLTLLRQLLEAGADVRRCSIGHQTALHHASLAARGDAVDRLLEAGAEPNCADAVGTTPLMKAATSGCVQCIESLLDAKADIDAADTGGDTALIAALRDDRFGASQLLHERGADWLKKGKLSAKQVARRAFVDIQLLFGCPSCERDGICCPKCRKHYCVFECDKFADPDIRKSFDCLLHRKLAHQAVLEWALAMSCLELPPYVVEHIFNALKVHSQNQSYSRRRATHFLWIPETSKRVKPSYVHLIVEERTHQENMKLFISVQKALQRKGRKGN